MARRPPLLSLLGSLLALLLTAGAAEALTYEVEQHASGRMILWARGEIQRGEAKRFAAALAALEGWQPALGLDSAGGIVDEGAAMGRLVRARAMPVIIPAGGTCNSACFLVFAAAAERIAGPASSIGVHSAGDLDGSEDDTSFAWTLWMAREAAQYGVPQKVLGEMVITPPGQVYQLDAADLAAMAVLNADLRPGRAAPLASVSLGQPASHPQFAAKSQGLSYRQGRADRTAWDAWLATQPAKSRHGAVFWAQNRSRAQTPGCPLGDAETERGCLEAGEWLARIDFRAASDTEYRRGWAGQ